MGKEIITIGYEIPGFSDRYIQFSSKTSLMDADIIILSAEDLYPHGDWVRFSSGGGGCYDVVSSKRYIKRLEHLKKEIVDSLKLGKTIFFILSDKVSHTLATGVTSTKGSNNYSTTSKSNYGFLPKKIGDITTAKGKVVVNKGNSLFTDFYNSFKDYLEYQVYFENLNQGEVLFTGRDSTKVLGSIHKMSKGHFITLPYIKYDNKAFTEEKDDSVVWTSTAIKFGERLIQSITQIDKQIKHHSNKTPAPKWVEDEIYLTKKAFELIKLLKTNEEKLEQLKTKKESYLVKLAKEHTLKDLLFESGKPLENAVTEALLILGFNAENYDDGTLELDQVVLSPEKHRYIGECEGKDTKDINITKFRQLVESLNADFAREEIEEKAFGILFGNPQRLTSPEKRSLDFTKKCKIGAAREKIALVRTPDLFLVTKYLKENRNRKFAKECRDAIYKGLGEVVQFPKLPK